MQTPSYECSGSISVEVCSLSLGGPRPTESGRPAILSVKVVLGNVVRQTHNHEIRRTDGLFLDARHS